MWPRLMSEVGYMAHWQEMLHTPGLDHYTCTPQMKFKTYRHLATVVMYKKKKKSKEN